MNNCSLITLFSLPRSAFSPIHLSEETALAAYSL